MSADQKPDNLAVAITTMNNMRTIELTLQSVRDLASRIVVVDSGSTDGTVNLCKSYGAEVVFHEFEGLTLQKQFAIDQCDSHPWVLLMDSDESLEPELQESMREILTVDDPNYAGWSFNRKVWFQGRWLNHVFQPEWRLRLVRQGRAKVVGIGPQGRGGHDKVTTDGPVGRLRGDCRHDSWEDIDDMINRHVGWARLTATYKETGGSLINILFNPPFALFKQLVLKRGFLDGPLGVVCAASYAFGTMVKHVIIAAKKAGLKE